MLILNAHILFTILYIKMIINFHLSISDFFLLQKHDCTLVLEEIKRLITSLLMIEVWLRRLQSRKRKRSEVSSLLLRFLYFFKARLIS